MSTACTVLDFLLDTQVLINSIFALFCFNGYVPGFLDVISKDRGMQCKLMKRFFLREPVT